MEINLRGKVETARKDHFEPQTYSNIPQTADQMRIAKVEQSSSGVAAFPTFGVLPAVGRRHELDKFGGASQETL